MGCSMRNKTMLLIEDAFFSCISYFGLEIEKAPTKTSLLYNVQTALSYGSLLIPFGPSYGKFRALLIIVGLTDN